MHAYAEDVVGGGGGGTTVVGLPWKTFCSNACSLVVNLIASAVTLILIQIIGVETGKLPTARSR